MVRKYKGFDSEFKCDRQYYEIGVAYGNNRNLRHSFNTLVINVLYSVLEGCRYAEVDITYNPDRSKNMTIVREIPLDEWKQLSTGTVKYGNIIYTFKNGLFHSEYDLPSIIEQSKQDNGTIVSTLYWHQDGYLRRSSGQPAIIKPTTFLHPMYPECLKDPKAWFPKPFSPFQLTISDHYLKPTNVCSLFV